MAHLGSSSGVIVDLEIWHYDAIISMKFMETNASRALVLSIRIGTMPECNMAASHGCLASLEATTVAKNDRRCTLSERFEGFYDNLRVDNIALTQRNPFSYINR